MTPPLQGNQFFASGPPNPKSQIYISPLQGTQKTEWFSVSLLFFDSLFEYSTFTGVGYWNKLSKTFEDLNISLQAKKKVEKIKRKFRKIASRGWEWYLCRGPPDCRCPYPPIDNQKLLLQQYVRDRGWNEINTYVDDGFSGQILTVLPSSG